MPEDQIEEHEPVSTLNANVESGQQLYSNLNKLKDQLHQTLPAVSRKGSSTGPSFVPKRFGPHETAITKLGPSQNSHTQSNLRSPAEPLGSVNHTMRQDNYGGLTMRSNGTIGRNSPEMNQNKRNHSPNQRVAEKIWISLTFGYTWNLSKLLSNFNLLCTKLNILILFKFRLWMHTLTCPLLTTSRPLALAVIIKLTKIKTFNFAILKFTQRFQKFKIKI